MLFRSGGNRLFISRDKGSTWTRTKDLTKDIERDSLSLMGVPGHKEMLLKHDGAASYSEITTIAESPLSADILWVGTDDGNVQVSRDGGESWTEVGRNLESVNDTTYVSRVVASAAAEGVACVTLDGHRDGDFAPYVFKTTNFGQTWTKITDGLTTENAGAVNVIVEHPDNSDVLFLGTEHALFVSTTAGRQWAEIKSGLPTARMIKPGFPCHPLPRSSKWKPRETPSKRPLKPLSTGLRGRCETWKTSTCAISRRSWRTAASSTTVWIRRSRLSSTRAETSVKRPGRRCLPFSG